MQKIPTIDLAEFIHGSADLKTAIARQVDEVCRNIGFLVISGHGVPDDTIERAWSTTRRFFDLSLSQKLEAKSADPACPRGYFPPESEALAKTHGEDTPPDLKEMFSIGQHRMPDDGEVSADARFFFGENIWPEDSLEFREAWLDYYRSMEDLGGRIMSLFAAALGLPSGYFVSFHKTTISALRAHNYPETDRQPLPGQQRAGVHSDYGSLTILKSDATVGGLEVRLPSGDWASPPRVPDAYIINIGDMMARWTNDRWTSTLHRVVAGSPGENGTTPRRQSLAFFYQPDWNARIECLPTCLEDGVAPQYPAVNSGAYLIDRFNESIQ